MNTNPDELRYTQSHEWVRLEDDGSVVVGITHHAQSQLGELVFVELPDKATSVDAGDEVAVVESVKAASDIYSPLSGEIIAVNDDLADAPGLINNDPYGDGWIFKLQPKDQEEYTELLEASAYSDLMNEDED